MEYCEYGCGQEAKFKTKGGKSICSKSPNSCPSIRKKNSEACLLRKDVYDRKPSYGMRGKTPWNKGLNKYNNEKCRQIAEKVSLSMKKAVLEGRVLGVGKTAEAEAERRRKISEKAKLSNGGYRKGSGRGKKGYYKGHWCDSSWELAFVFYNIENGIAFSRNTKKFSYELDGKKHSFIPDFIIEGVFLEIKGRKNVDGLDEQNKAKIAQFPSTEVLKVLFEDDMKMYLEFVIERHGKDFVRLYELPK